MSNGGAAIHDPLEIWADLSTIQQPLLSGYAQGLPRYVWQWTDRRQPGRTDP